MRFINIRLPENISSNAVGMIEFSTSLTVMSNKNEVRNANWSEFRYKYNIANGIKSYKDYQTLKSFFILMQGRSSTFRFKDFSDYTVNNGYIGIGDGATKVFYFSKIYSINNITTIKHYTKLVADTVSVFTNNVLQDSSKYAVDYLNGTVTFINPPAIGEIITSSFEFDISVRFDSDTLEFFINTSNKFQPITELNLVEVNN